MSHILIITEDIVKVETFTGVIGRAYTKLFLNWLKLRLELKIWWLSRFVRVSVLVSDGLKLTGQGYYSYSQELSRLDYARERSHYWQETEALLNRIKTFDPALFSVNGLDITRVFATRLCTN